MKLVHSNRNGARFPVAARAWVRGRVHASRRARCSRAALVAGLILALPGCGGGGGGGTPAPISNTPPPTPPPATSQWQVANPSSRWKNVLVACVEAETPAESCTLSRLPLIGTSTNERLPNIDEIIDRTVVSKPWMGDRFRAVLQRLPPEIRTLLKGVTAVVIATENHPSYYTPITGAIYIDPYYFWLSNAEKADVANDADYRTSYGDALLFLPLARYVRGTQYAWNYYDLDGNETREIYDIDRQLASVLFHELAHANDAAPPAERIYFNPSLTIFEATESIPGRRIADQLEAYYPLNSQMWQELGRVLYLGAAPTAAQRQLTGAQVGLELQNDGANDDYAYASQWEDLAMLFEELMMAYHYDVEREIAMTNLPRADEQEYCDYYIVQWGVKSRLGDPLVQSRAAFVARKILDTPDVSMYLNALRSQWRMTQGYDWCRIQNRGTAPERPGRDGAAHLQSTPETPTPLRPSDRSARRHL